MVNILTMITLSNLEIRGVSFLNLAKTQRKKKKKDYYEIPVKHLQIPTESV